MRDSLRSGAGRPVGFALVGLAQDSPQEPVFIDITPPANDDVSGLADILIGALGLSGILLLVAVLAGLAVGALVFWLRSRSSGGAEE
jgi:hypothetical protein